MAVFQTSSQKAESMFELAMKPQRSSFLILTLMSHWRAWGEAKWSLGPLAHSDVLFQTEQLLFSCQKRSASQCVGVCLVTTNTACVHLFHFIFTEVIKTQLDVCFILFPWVSSIKKLWDFECVCVSLYLISIIKLNLRMAFRMCQRWKDQTEIIICRSHPWLI